MTFIFVKWIQKWSGIHIRGLTSIPTKDCGEGGDAQHNIQTTRIEKGEKDCGEGQPVIAQHPIDKKRKKKKRKGLW